MSQPEYYMPARGFVCIKTTCLTNALREENNGHSDGHAADDADEEVGGHVTVLLK